MPTNFFTNHEENNLIRKFEGVLKHVPTIRHFDVLVGYFRASGYFKVRPFLDNITKIRILVGIDVDKITKEYHEKGKLFFGNDDLTKQEFVKNIIQNIQEAKYDETTEKGIIQFFNDLTSEKIEMRAHPEKTIHAKIYIFKGEVFNEYTPCEVITGSSNMTDAGMGTYDAANYEFNVSLRGYEDVKFAADEFERLWAESVPILKQQVEAIKNKSYLRDDCTPFELYIKMMIEYFGKRIEYDPYNIEMLLPDSYRTLKYQTDAANQGYAMMMKNNGFILADVVGLGKTIIACMVIKKFIYENGTHTNVLIVCPPAIKNNWVNTAKDFGIKRNLEFITIGSLQKVIDGKDYSKPHEIDLIVVDESHKFRNDYTGMYLLLQEICKKSRSNRADNGDDKKKVILVSATPLNNRPQDIENQLYLFQDKRNSTLENIRNLQSYFKPINDEYLKLSNERPLNNAKIKALFEKLRNDIIEPLVIRRTRKDIDNNNDYREDLIKQNIKFPKIGDPTRLNYTLDTELSSLFDETVELIAGVDADGNALKNGLDYYRYRAIEFLIKKEDRDLYGKVELISARLAQVMRILLVKRLESSFEAFKISLNRLHKAIDNMLDMFAKDTIFIAPDLDVNKLMADGLSYEDIEKKVLERSGNNRQFKKADFQDVFIKYLESDKKKVEKLLVRWNKVDTDPKLEAFIEQVKNRLLNPEINQSQKIVIFTEAKDTVDYLKKALEANGFNQCLGISSDNRSHLEEKIKENFDANFDEKLWKDDVNIIITTEVLAEGINLHRSNVIVNYDVPWNATRLMQRIGRVNRIGTRADKIFVFNFYPSAEGDSQLRLVNNALRKLQAFHSAFGEDNKIFSILEEVGDGGLHGSGKEEESEILKFLNELREFRKNHAKRFAEIDKLPFKVRCGRKADAPTIDEYPPQYLHHSTLAYLKSDNHKGVFCLVTPDKTAELSFLNAAYLFKAPEKEKAIALHKAHHTQTEQGLTFFETEQVQQTVAASVSRKDLSSAEKKALNNLNYAHKVALTPQKRTLIERAIEQIKNGSNKKLPNDINKFFDDNKQQLNKPDFLDNFSRAVLDRYDRPADSEPKDTGDQNNESRKVINPKIVLTISFD